MGGVRRAPLVALTAVATLLMLGASACSGNSQPVGLGTADRGSVTEVVDASATVTARAAATLTAPSAGTLGALLVTPGQSVTAGQVVALINSPAAQQQLSEAQAALAAAGGTGGTFRGTDLTAAQKQIDAAAAQYATLSATARSVITSVQRGLASLSAALGALGAAQRAQAQSAYDLAKSTVDALTLKAPIAGVVQLGGAASAPGGSLGSLLGAAAAGGAPVPAPAAGPMQPAGPGVDPAVLVGTPVGAGTAIATIVDTSALGLLADVDETDVLLVSPGVSAQVELDAAPGGSYAATVGSVDVLPTTSSQGGVAYRVRLTLGAGRYDDGRPAPTPRPGMSAVAHLAVREAHDAVTVPAAAIVRVDGHDNVWLVRDGRAQRVQVSLGVQGPDRVQVVSGVAPGDRVVIKGADRVKTGQSL